MTKFPMLWLFISSLLSVLAHEADIFQRYVQKWGKTYKSEDEKLNARAAFFRNLNVVESLEASNDGVGSSYQADVMSSRFGDLSWEDFRPSVLMDAQQECSATGGGLPGSVGISHSTFHHAKSTNLVPDFLDWRDKGIVSEVKNQGQCGSCWTFASTGAIEAHQAIKYGAWRAPRVSEQQLVDCAGDFNNFGCNGGLPSRAFEYIKHAGGIAEEFSYHYEAQDKACRFSSAVNRTIIGTRVSGGSINITRGDEDAIMYYLATRGPVAIAYQVTNEFRFYKSGVFQTKNCGQTPKDVNHAVLVVGYGTEAGLPYWLIKNSWGYDWGENGYFKMLRGKNMCGIAECASLPLIVDAPPSEVTSSEEAEWQQILKMGKETMLM